jgi:hypothetical protein
MAYINGLRSFGDKSRKLAKVSKTCPSTEMWLDALAKAESAHHLCREAAKQASMGKFDDAEKTAVSGIASLKESILGLPPVKLQTEMVLDKNAAMRA